jgi:hypothetical protein
MSLKLFLNFPGYKYLQSASVLGETRECVILLFKFKTHIQMKNISSLRTKSRTEPLSFMITESTLVLSLVPMIRSHLHVKN